MREIKFRAWDRVNHEMIPDSTINLQRAYSGMFQGEGNWTPMQYTGLKDSEGVEIYEGDIVEFTYWWFDGNHTDSLLTGELVYLPQSLSFGLRGVKNTDWIKHIGGEEGSSDTTPFATWQFAEDDFRVIGNIYENPELLEVKT